MTKYKLITLAFASILIIGCGQDKTEENSINVVSCPEDARICDDGTILMRQGADCEYKACPEVKSVQNEKQ